MIIQLKGLGYGLCISRLVDNALDKTYDSEIDGETFPGRLEVFNVYLQMFLISDKHFSLAYAECTR